MFLDKGHHRRQRQLHRQCPRFGSTSSGLETPFVHHNPGRSPQGRNIWLSVDEHNLHLTQRLTADRIEGLLPAIALLTDDDGYREPWNRRQEWPLLNHG